MADGRRLAAGGRVPRAVSSKGLGQGAYTAAVWRRHAHTLGVCHMNQRKEYIYVLGQVRVPETGEGCPRGAQCTLMLVGGCSLTIPALWGRVHVDGVVT